MTRLGVTFGIVSCSARFRTSRQVSQAGARDISTPRRETFVNEFWKRQKRAKSAIALTHGHPRSWIDSIFRSISTQTSQLLFIRLIFYSFINKLNYYYKYSSAVLISTLTLIKNVCESRISMWIISRKSYGGKRMYEKKIFEWWRIKMCDKVFETFFFLKQCNVSLTLPSSFDEK